MGIGGFRLIVSIRIYGRRRAIPIEFQRIIARLSLPNLNSGVLKSTWPDEFWRFSGAHNPLNHTAGRIHEMVYKILVLRSPKSSHSPLFPVRVNHGLRALSEEGPGTNGGSL